MPAAGRLPEFEHQADGYGTQEKRKCEFKDI
jgi:hypothetical protein